MAHFLILFVLSVFLVSCNGVSFSFLKKEESTKASTFELKNQTKYLPFAKEELLTAQASANLMPYTIVGSPPSVLFDLEHHFQKVTKESRLNQPPAFLPTPLVISYVNPTSLSFTQNKNPLPKTTKWQTIPLEKQIFLPLTHHVEAVPPPPPHALDFKVDDHNLEPVFIPPPAEELISTRALAEKSLSKTEEQGTNLKSLPFFVLNTVPKKGILVAQNFWGGKPHNKQAIKPIGGPAIAFNNNMGGQQPTHVFKQASLVNGPAVPRITYQNREENTPTLTIKTTAQKPEPVFIPPPLDIVFVIDTSVSMIDMLSEFNKRFAFFLSYFSFFDWRVMITNADHGDTWFPLFNMVAPKGEALPLERDGKVLKEERYIDRSLSNYNQVFLSSISLHKWGDYTKYYGDSERNIPPCDLPPGCQTYKEQPLKSLKSALIKNPDFFREEANLAVILISNSQEKATSSSVSAEEVFQQFEQVHGGGHKRFEVYGLIIRENDEECLLENLKQQTFLPEVGVSKKIMTLSDMTGGEVFSLCSPDYQGLAHSIATSFSTPL